MLLSVSAYAKTDPWYETNPSCVIERGNPARTGEYKVIPLKKIHETWNTPEYYQAPVPLICYQDKKFSGVHGTYFVYGKKKELYPLTGRTVLYDNVFYNTTTDSANRVHLIGNSIKDKTLVFDELLPDFYHDPFIYNNIAYMGNSHGILAYDLINRKLLWMFKHTFTELLGFSTDGKNLFFSDWYGSLFALDLIHGQLIWQKDNFFLNNDYVRVNKGKVIGVGGGTIIKNKKQVDYHFVYALNSKNGAILWKTSVEEGTRGPVTLVNNRVLLITALRQKTGPYHYVHDTHAKLECLDALSGKVIWKISIEPVVPSYDIVATKHYAYVGTGREFLIININKGKIISRYKLPDTSEIGGVKWLTPILLLDNTIVVSGKNYDRYIYDELYLLK